MDLDLSHTGVVVRGGVRIPRSSPRSYRLDYAKILTSVDPDAEHAMGFVGQIVRPGTVVTAAQLWPDEKAPRMPIVLESGWAPGQEKKFGHNRRDRLYILWRYNPERDEWTEVGKAQSVAWEWAIDLRPLAVRLMREARPAVEVMAINFLEVQDRIAALLERELTGLEDPDRWKVLGILHDQLAWRVAQSGCNRVTAGSMMHGM